MNLLNLLFSFDGRIGRAAYAGGWLLNLVVMLAAMGVVTYLRLYWTPHEPFNLKDGSLLALTPTTALVYCITWLFHWVQLALAAKRLHDLGITGWFSLPMITPGPNLIMAVVLMILHGEDKDNRYGPGAPSTGATAPA
jgi:uncharacterized membrane protein YhaH (DUF805 family)